MPTRTKVDFNNTEIAFSGKSNKDLNQTERLFKLMSNPSFVKFGSYFGNFAIKARLPLSKFAIKKTIFKQFCGGENLWDSVPLIENLYKYRILTVLDYGVESKSNYKDLEKATREICKAIEFAASNESVPVVSLKVTALVDNHILEKFQKEDTFDESENQQYDQLLKRLNTICGQAYKLGVKIFVDAEESWLQSTIDHLVTIMMSQYNKESVTVYNTFQLYRTDRLNFLYESFEKSRSKDYLLGAKIVRGAYMEKERDRAEELGYQSPIQVNKTSTDSDYNDAVRFLVKNYKEIASCNATHNIESNALQAELIKEMGIHRNHPHLNFCQLLGMSDYITYNLADAGFNVAKYVVYGPVRDVLPYLVRRAEENTSITGELGRELSFIKKEKIRRGLLSKQ